MDKFSYLIIKPPQIASGVIKKVENIVSELLNKGHSTTLFSFSTNLTGLVGLVYSIVFNDANKIIIRFPGVLRTILIFPFVLISRFFGKIIILELPTPLIVALNEIKGTSTSLIFFYRSFSVFIFYPWVLLPYNWIIQSGWEHPYFLLFLKNKSRLIGNGISVESLPLKNKNYNPNYFTCICVAQLEFWHGFDRILFGLHDYLKSTNSRNLKKIRIFIVGDGNEKSYLDSLVKRLNLNSFVVFFGNTVGLELDELFNLSDVAFGSLGSHRVGLKISSPLKTREYCSRGIPFISSDVDPDFPDSLQFIYKVSNDDSPISFEKIIFWYNGLSSNSAPYALRSFAKTNLDFSRKVELMFF